MDSIGEANNLTVYRAGSNAPIGSVSRIRGALPIPIFNSVNPVSPVSWSDGGAGGTFQISGVNDLIAIYTPANRTQIVTISAIDSAGLRTRILTVQGTLPLQPQIGFELELDQETKIKLAKDRTRYFREEGGEEVGWAFGYHKRELYDRDELKTFWRHHRKVIPFWTVDEEGNMMNQTWFVSSFKAIPEGGNRWNLAVGVRGVYQELTAEPTQPLSLKINCGGYLIGAYQADQFYTNGITFYDNTGSIDSSNIQEPAPDEVYRWSRYDGDYVQYLVTGLRRSWPHNIRLHFAAEAGRKIVPTIQLVTKPEIIVPISKEAIAELYENINSDAEGNLLIRVDHTEGVNTLLNAIEIDEV